MRRRVVVIASHTGPGAEAVERALGQALDKQGLEVLDTSKVDQADLVVAVTAAVRTGDQWGGIPSQQVLLRYDLLDARKRTPIRSGADWASYADPVAQRRVAGALRGAADRLSRKLISVVRDLPPPSPAETAAPKPAPAAEKAVSISLACLPFRNATHRRQLDGWCESLASIAAQEFKRVKTYRIVERARLADILKEDDIAAAIDTSPGAVRRVAQKLGVDLLLVGEASLRPNGDLVISARMVKAKDAEVQQVIYAAGPAASVDRLEQSFRHQLVKPTVGWVSRQLDHLNRAPIVWPKAGPGR